MKISIKSKLMIAITLLVTVLFTFSAFIFVKEKKVEFAQDIYLNALAFSRLTADSVVSNYELYLADSGFVYFNREISDLFDKNTDVSEITVVSYTGEIVYDSLLDNEKKYVGELRLVGDDLLGMIQSEDIALRTLEDQKIVFLHDGKFVDALQKPVAPLPEGTLIDFMVMPASEKYSVVYKLDYANLYTRLDAMRMRIIYLALFGVLLGVLMSLVMSRQVTKPVFALVKGAESVAAGDFKTRVVVQTHDELAYLGDAFNKMTKDLEESVEAKVYQQRVTRELELAAKIQDQLIPDDDEIPKVSDLDIAADIIPAEEIGGDLYDFLRVSESKILMYLGDVTGHGVPAGIVSSIASALFYGYRKQIELKDILVAVNGVLKAKTMPNMFMTLCLLLWDEIAKSLQYVSAGHEQLIHYSVELDKAVLMPSGGVALGMFVDIEKHLKTASVDFKKGDCILVYSDGIPEAWSNPKDVYGVERLVDTFGKFSRTLQTAAEIRDAVIGDVNAFRNGYKQQDDITIIVLKRI
ncbi:SpoIIE family protein phosphatase [Candidatus Peregrinibacteria bacterium]|nr:SpoIIE family protein phosphatase [Candidatus Peregrinibacteria bacterium]